MGGSPGTQESLVFLFIYHMKTLLMDGQVIGLSETGDGCGTEGGGGWTDGTTVGTESLKVLCPRKQRQGFEGR